MFDFANPGNPFIDAAQDRMHATNNETGISDWGDRNLQKIWITA